jgi:acyl-CoA reductase-like NAD-dependent aldehyde dehydrogenase
VEAGRSDRTARDELAELETLDNGKPLRISRAGDIPSAAKHFRYYAGLGRQAGGQHHPGLLPNQFVYTLREPVGVVGLIIPWNFPLLMAPGSWPRPWQRQHRHLETRRRNASHSPAPGRIDWKAGFPDGVVNILTGPGEPDRCGHHRHPGHRQSLISPAPPKWAAKYAGCRQRAT